MPGGKPPTASKLSPDSPAFLPAIHQLRLEDNGADASETSGTRQDGPAPCAGRPRGELSEHSLLRQPRHWQQRPPPQKPSRVADATFGAAPLPLAYGHLAAAPLAQQQPVVWVPFTLTHQPHVLAVPPLPIVSEPHLSTEAAFCRSVAAPGPAASARVSLATALPSSLNKAPSTANTESPDRKPKDAERRPAATALIPDEEAACSESDSSEEEAGAPAASVQKTEGAESLPSYGKSWDTITEPIMRVIVQRLDSRSQQLCRRVSKHWYHCVTSNLQAIQPRRAKVQTVREKFVSLTNIDFSACENVRNRNLAILEASKLKLKSITIGHVATVAYGKPRITNSALVNLSHMPSLIRLSLADCSAITNNSMQVLSRLTNLQELAFVRCRRITEKGLELVELLPSLTSLTVFGCSKVTEALLVTARALPRLESLHLGHMRLQPDSLASLASYPALSELTIHGEELPPASLTALGMLTQLRALGMTTCYQLNGTLAISMLHGLTGLQRVNLQSYGGLTNGHLHLIAARLQQLQQLKIVLSLSVSASGIEALANLRDLEAISFDSLHAAPAALKAVSKLTSLRVAEFQGTSMPSQLLEALPLLPRLEVLNLSNYEAQSMMRTELVFAADDILALARCRGLRRLDVSNTVLSFFMASELLQRFATRKKNGVRFEELCLAGCPITPEHIELLGGLHPLIHVHQNRRGVLPSSTWVWSRDLYTTKA